MHNDFTLFYRVVPSGKKVVYYYAYDDEGRRLGPWTTGQANKTAARNYCNQLNRKGNLLPGLKEMPTFAEFAENFWDWEKSAYLKERQKRRKLTVGYAEHSKRTVEKTLLPYFGKMKLDKITAADVEKWIDYMIKLEYKNTSINTYYMALKTMISWAAKHKYIPTDPLTVIERLRSDRREIKIFTAEEFKRLFVGNWREVWKNDFLKCTANKLAALTGMRLSEVLGLRGEYVYEKNLLIAGQYDRYGYRETKTKIKHHVPLTAELVQDLERLKKMNGQGFVFSLNGGIKPVDKNALTKSLSNALQNIGLSADEIKARGLTFHAWRHFCNTQLQRGGLPIKMVQAITGHKSERMTELYTHFDPSEFGEAPLIQAQLLEPIPEPATAEQTECKILRMPERAKTA